MSPLHPIFTKVTNVFEYLEERIQKLDLEIYTPLAEKKRPKKERGRELENKELEGAPRKGRRKSIEDTNETLSDNIRGNGASCTILGG